jgi:hypothetical protein
MMLLIVPLRHGKRRHRERQHRGNGNYAQHSDLSFFSICEALVEDNTIKVLVAV